MQVGSQITFGGLASGMDTRAIIDALMNVERIPILRLQNKKQVLSQQDGIYSQLKTLLDDLRTKAEAVDTPQEIGAFTATSSNEHLGVSAAGAAGAPAVAGTYDISVLNLAKAESRATGGFADQDTTDIGSGTFTITVGTDVHTVDLSANPTNTLQDVRDAINASGAPVTATIINNGTSTDPYQLVLSSDETGVANSFAVDLTGFTTTNPTLFNIDDPVASRLQAAEDSHVQINGLDVYRPSNKITDAVQGLTLDLQTTLNNAQVTVETDTEGIKNNIQEFVDAYNSIMDIIHGQGQVDESGQTNAVLFGDSGLRGIAGQLRTALNTEASSTGSLYATLAAIGVTSGSDGNLSIDSGDLDDAIADDLAGVLSLFANTTDGVAETFKNLADTLTDPVDGIIQARRDGIESRKENIDDRIADLEDRLDRYEQRLVNRFASMETLVSSFQAQGAALSNALLGQ